MVAEIAVNKAQWDSIGNDEQRKISEGLKSVGSLKPDDTIVGAEDAPEFTAQTKLAPLWNPIEDLCKAACDVAAGAAVAWCTANTGGAATAVCIAAAEVARQKCRDAC